MKILGLSCGRKMQNTEILVKEALMGAEEAGAEVQFISMLGLEIKPCIFCKNCKLQSEGECIIKDDDGNYLYNVIMDYEGLILGSPVYSLTPPGILKMFEDRMMGPKTDKAFILEMKKLGEKDRMGNPRYIDGRIFKRRVGAFISLGGAITPDWLSFGLPLLHTMTFPPQIDLVDQMQVTGAGLKGHSVMLDNAIARAHKLGRNVAETLSKPIEKMKWLGDEPGTCPVCHSNLLIIGKRNPVICPICGSKGTIKIDGDNISVTFTKKERERSRLTMAGKYEHWVELGNNARAAEKASLNEIEKRLKKYRGYAEKAKPARKSKSK